MKRNSVFVFVLLLFTFIIYILFVMIAIVKLIFVVSFLPYIFVAWVGVDICLLELVPLAWYVRDSKTRLPIRYLGRAKLPQISGYH